MTVRTTLSFTDRHHRFLVHKVEEGVFASAGAAVATAVEQMSRTRQRATRRSRPWPRRVAPA